MEAVSLCALSELHTLHVRCFWNLLDHQPAVSVFEDDKTSGSMTPVVEQDAPEEALMILPPTDDVISEASDDRGEQETGPEAINVYRMAVQSKFEQWQCFARVSITNASKLVIGEVDIRRNPAFAEIPCGVFVNICQQMREGYVALVSQYYVPPIPRLLVEGVGITPDFHVLLGAADIIGLRNFFAHFLNVRRMVRVKKFWQEAGTAHKKVSTHVYTSRLALSSCALLAFHFAV